MRLVTFRGDGDVTRTGVVADDSVVDLTEAVAALPIPPERAARLAQHGITTAPGGMLRLLQAGDGALRLLARQIDARAARRKLAEITLLAPVPRPGKIVAVGRNYADHAKETGVDPFEKPRIIAKLPSSVVGPGAVVKRPAAVRKLDFEAELAVVIGDFASNVPMAHAFDFVAGYTALNDLSAREFQFDIAPPQTTFAKSMDGFCPMGPWIVTKDEIADIQALDIVCDVNGTRMQQANTADMLFPVARLIEYVTQFMTLEPGDVLATGTPAGIGAFRKPPMWLKPGDRIRIEIARIGVLEHGIG